MKRHSKLQTCPLVILYSISANSPSKQQGGRHTVFGAMGSVDRVITLWVWVGGVGNRTPGQPQNLHLRLSSDGYHLHPHRLLQVYLQSTLMFTKAVINKKLFIYKHVHKCQWKTRNWSSTPQLQPMVAWCRDSGIIFLPVRSVAENGFEVHTALCHFPCAPKRKIAMMWSCNEPGKPAT